MLKNTIFAVAVISAAGANAQSPARPDPMDPKAAIPARPGHDSAFKDYRPYTDAPAANWRGANEEVGRLGGHLGHVPRAPGNGRPADPKAAPERDSHGAHGGRK